MQKAVHDCSTGKLTTVDIDPAEESKMLAEWAKPAVAPRATVNDEIANLKARLAALEAKP